MDIHQSQRVSLRLFVFFTIAAPLIAQSPSGTLIPGPGSLTFSAPAGQSPPAQTLSLSALTGPFSVRYSQDVPWLMTTVTIGSLASIGPATPAVLSVKASAVSLLAGTYSAHIFLTPSTGTMLVIPVLFNVSAGGTITANEMSYTFVYPGNALQTFTSVGSSNPALTTFAYTVASQSNWLRFQGFGAGSYSAPGFGLVSISADPAVAAALPLGTYVGTVTLSPPQSPSDTTVIHAALIVGGDSTSLAVTPTNLSFTASPGGAAQSQTLAFTMSGNTTAAVLYATSYNTAFYSISSPGCNLTPNPAAECALTGSQNLTVSVNPSILSVPGTYVGSLLFYSGAAKIETTLILNISASPATLSVNPASLSFATTAGSVPQTQELVIQAPDNTPETASLISYNGAFFHVAGGNCNAIPDTSPSCTFNAPQTLQVTVDPTKLTVAGTYTGDIQIQSAGVTTTIPVILTLAGAVSGTPSGGMTVAPPALTFYSQNSEPPPPKQFIRVQPSDNVSFQVAVDTPQAWLSVTTQGTPGPGYLAVSVNPQGLTRGFFAGTVIIGTSSGIVSVPVTLVITAVGVLEATPGTSIANFSPPNSVSTTEFTLSSTDSAPTSVNVSTTTPWITVQSLTPSGVTPATFFLTLFGYGLCNGLTTGSVTVDAPNSGDDGFTIPVASLTNGSTAVGCSTDTLAPAPASLTLTSPDGINYPAQTLTITSPANPIGAPFTYSVTGNVPLSVSVNGVSVPPGESLTTPATLSITANPAGLIPGTYTAAVSLKSNAMVQLVPVTLVIGQPPRTLTATPASLGFTAAPGASAGTQTVTLSTISQQPITILGVSSDSLDFLRAAITGGGNSVTVNNPVILTVAASVPLYAPVNAHITITSTAGLLTIPVAVSPQATSSPIIAAPGSIALGLSERANPMPVVDPVTLTTTSTSPVLLARITSDASWLSATASSQTISATAPATLMVTINPAHLASDSYVGHITLTPGSGDATVIPVSINVTPADANVFASPTSLRFTYPSYTLPSLVLFDSASPALMVTNLTIASRGDWLRVSGLRGGSYTGVNFGQHDVTFDPAVAAGLAAGTYSGTITVADPFNTNDLAIIHTILTVNPVKVLSQGKAASQSSIYPGSPPAGAAVDGNTSGNYFDGSVTSTNSEASPWWQVDLGASAPITAINIWNRNDCCGSRLQDFWVFVSDTPFQPGDTVASLQNRSGTYANHQTSPPSPLAVIGAQTQGRYVRVQLNTTQILSLAEVQVLGSDAPLLSNVAAGKIATQSSTLPGTPTANAAVDGHTDGNFFDGSVTATNLESTPWWQVDLGASTAITSMVIWNRTDCCGSRLSDYWVFISDTPFQSTDTPALLASRRGTFGIHQTAAPGPITTIPASTQGRYVRVQLSGTDYLSLAEVEVFGSATGAGPAKVASQSTTYPGAPGASAATDGNTDGNFFDGSVTATNQESSPWWQVDLGAATMVGTVTIWNRTDCCGSRLSDYWVFASNTPFAPTDTPATLQGRAGTFGSHQTGAPSPSMSIPVNFQARYVRVQLSGTDYLSLAEVQIQ